MIVESLRFYKEKRDIMLDLIMCFIPSVCIIIVIMSNRLAVRVLFSAIALAVTAYIFFG